MDLTNFSTNERQALLDLFIMGMYADGHLASAEDAHARRLLAEMGHHFLTERNYALDAAITRVRRHAPSLSNYRTYVAALAHAFRSQEQRAQVYSLIADLMGSDSEIAPPEQKFLAIIKEVFEM